MKNTFALDFTGPQTRCDFPGCVLASFHDGDHEFAASKPRPQGPIYTCIVCRVQFVVYGQTVPGERQVCGARECIELYAKALARLQGPLPLSCRCPQRDYPHDVTVHLELRNEAYNPARRQHWPWSLMLSEHVEPSSETRAA
jgi:hypothetical protein